ncbi:3-deoxy-manno-octulosonate cytidylyltransferase (CMP-KDO synthetase) [Geoalkalibacter ferrihydriticus]|uniref:3-deoxy-manno-octulosonate cytidylyltransferase n=2 Tax=Geoalkalibacter ferrihydriticus TaxID=392333 RepID=A0A0C2HNQ5_9BACT|nr:3-deoxy-manno-octulosonate cytidylyltransferase [Geoalkalibacter ferrihydriticus]KIH76565.1 3-deoxy-manno-octulosonate cytidylyltransferase [Geoalkalibacter ferrihydriticus DSM 17813]SDM01707.1 3-deoxy-manno-octulosonate cytidylyltransferase (CMP-KDO synthetase) [Geoalkalibacter ferrihydriticus]
MNVTAIIPARYASTRFPGKPLVDILGKSMIQRVYERVSGAPGIDRVLVATDDRRIFDAVRAFGGDAEMTRDDHPTGTDRLAEVAARIDADLVVNVQGDEPLIDPLMIEAALAPLRDDATIVMGTLKTPISTVDEFLNPNVVKVVTDRRGFALYFSRAPIPHPRDLSTDLESVLPQIAPYKHVGLYVYRRDFLLQYPRLPATPLENLEKLEQLRALEHGFRIRVEETALGTLGVDTPADLDRVRLALTQE